MKPLAIDLFCGLGGWTEGLLAEGYDVVGFDIERHVYGEHRYPAQLVLQDVLTLQGWQFKDAALIVASPPCQAYSYMAMPWKLGKAKAADYREHPQRQKELNALFDVCFRIQREASAAAGRHIPLVVENVRGAQPWVGRAAWNYGSYFLWGDVPALMPNPKGGFKSSGMNWSNRTKHGQDFTRIAGNHAIKLSGGKDFRRVSPDTGRKPKHTPRLTNPAEHLKCGTAWFTQGGVNSMRAGVTKNAQRRFASAMIAKIPFQLARHIAAVNKGGHA
jgi:hypothetical protein